VARDLTRLRSRAVLGWTGVAVAAGNAAAALLPEAGPARLPLVLAFTCLGPGCAIVSHAAIDEPATAWALVVALSLAVVALSSATLAWIQWWHPAAGSVILAGVAAGSCLVALRSGRAPVAP
jgi:hypothetical protein